MTGITHFVKFGRSAALLGSLELFNLSFGSLCLCLAGRCERFLQHVHQERLLHGGVFHGRLQLLQQPLGVHASMILRGKHQALRSGCTIHEHPVLRNIRQVNVGMMGWQHGDLLKSAAAQELR